MSKWELASQSPFNFKVAERPIYARPTHGAPVVQIEGHKGLFREDDERCLAVVSDSYSVIQNAELFSSAMREVEQAMGDMGQYVINDDVAYHGGVCLRNIIFPDRYRMVAGKKVALRLILLNGFGRTAIKLYFGAIDFFCTNGVIRGSYDHVVKKHTSGLTIDRVGQTVRRSIHSFEADTELWNAWASKSITRDTASETIKALPSMSRLLHVKLMSQVDMEFRERGKNVWALYSALTYYSSHNAGDFKLRETKNDHAAMTMLHREEQVRGWINAPAWQSMLAT